MGSQRGSSGVTTSQKERAVKAFAEEVVGKAVRKIADIAAYVAKDYQGRDITWVDGADASKGGRTSDCSHFVHDVLTQAGCGVPYESTFSIGRSPYFELIRREQPRRGDVIVQGDHMGIYVGDEGGKPHAIQMGKHGARDVPWGGRGFPAGRIRFYRLKR